MDTSDYLQTPKGKLSRYRWRARRRVRIRVSGIEPRGKGAMPNEDKLAFQDAVERQLKEAGRRAFRAPIALSLSLHTTDETPSYPRTIAKNVLDLLGEPLPGYTTRRSALLYRDDSQVHALSVQCHHGQLEPTIRIEAAAFRHFLADLRLAESILDRMDRYSREDTANHDHGSIDVLRDLLTDRKTHKNQLGSESYTALLHIVRAQAQEELLGSARATVQDLANLFRVGPITNFAELKELSRTLQRQWEEIFRSTPLRISLPELPVINGASTKYKQQIKEEIESFSSQYERILDPLVTPVALEVMVKAPPPSRSRGSADLDNIARKYLLPAVEDVLSPPRTLLWAMDPTNRERFKREWTGPYRDLVTQSPPSMKVGVTRFEIWKLPRAENDESWGFVNVAVVADAVGVEDLFSQIDEAVNRLAES